MPKPKRASRDARPVAAPTQWELPNGYSLTICGDVLQVRDPDDVEVLALTALEVDRWSVAMTEAHNVMGGFVDMAPGRVLLPKRSR